jgi:hypothetical protein
MAKDNGGVAVQTRKAHDRVDECVDDVIKEASIDKGEWDKENASGSCFE